MLIASVAICLYIRAWGMPSGYQERGSGGNSCCAAREGALNIKMPGLEHDHSCAGM
jgi:hypothetical protein